MARADFADYDESGEGEGRFSRIGGALSTAVGAAMALGLLAAVGGWFYGLGTREAHEVPIIRAMAEPSKTRPNDPGGIVTPYQQITSYRTAESAPVEAGAVTVAPPPVAPRRDDVAMGQLLPKPEKLPPAENGSNEPAEEVASLDPLTGATLPPERADTLTDAQAEGQTEDQAAADAEAETPEPFVGGTALAPSASPRAPRRPSNLRERVARAEEEGRREVEELETRAASSGVQIQLSADPSETTIRAQWVQIYDKNKDILRDRTLAVQATQSGGTTWYRLRVGPFRDRSEALTVCQALIARGQDCIVARNS